MTNAVQLGFVAGALLSAALNLADVVRPQVLIPSAAAVGAAANLVMALAVDSLELAIFLRAVTGMSLAAVYPPGIKLVASWFGTRRGLAIGVLVGALTLGSASPHVPTALSFFSWRSALMVSSALALIGALLVALCVRAGPLWAPTPRFAPGYGLEMLRDRAQRLVSVGYVGHMWELYAFWTWLPAFVAASLEARSATEASAALVAVSSFALIGLLGFAGCVSAGVIADRVGPTTVTIAAMSVSGGCCLAAVLVYGAHPALLALLLAIWAATVIADSAQFSAALTHVADQRYLGTALTIQTAVGFLITVVSIRLVPEVAEHASWRYAFAPLAVGPLLGALAMAQLRADPLVGVGIVPSSAND